MINAIIIDDEPLILDNLNYIFQQLENASVLKSFTNPVEALNEYSALKPDVVIVDINMPNMNGLEFAEKIRALDAMANIIFLTAYENYAVSAFAVNAVDYILKPVTTSKLKRSLDRIRPRHETEKPEITINQPNAKTAAGLSFKIPGLMNNRIYLIEPKDALYISVNQRQVSLHTPEHEYLLKQKISYWEAVLANYGWFRCHRLFLINMNQISEVSLMFNNTYDIRMKNCSDVISVSRTYAADFKNYLNI